MNMTKGEQITRKSFQIIRDRLGNRDYTSEKLEIITRIAHTTGDVDFATTFYMDQDALEKGIRAAQSACSIISDVEMVRTGIRKTLANELGCEVSCFLNHPWVIKKSQTSRKTRSSLGMDRAGDGLNNAIVAIGNAPTALFRLLELIKNNKAAPALIIGVPVGFVGALESKTALFQSQYPCITNLSERGGSPIAAAIVNGILELALLQKNKS
ncbi:MAG: precorrin-8X methylmutase [Spirochaetales bacterium]|nr:precorrin-8X methylmutase [Spirochaetales bacterium]